MLKSLMIIIKKGFEVVELNCDKYSKKAKRGIVYIIFFISAILLKDFIGAFLGSIIIIISAYFFLRDVLPYVRCIIDYNKRFRK